MRSRTGIGVGIALLLAVSAAHAIEPDRLGDPGAALLEEPEDYDVGNGGWNGLSTFVQLAAGDGFDVTAVTGVDWDQLTAEDTLVILYPLNELDSTNVAAFVRQGGKLVLGDDFGYWIEGEPHVVIVFDKNGAFYEDSPPDRSGRPKNLKHSTLLMRRP